MQNLWPTVYPLGQNCNCLHSGKLMFSRPNKFPTGLMFCYIFRCVSSNMQFSVRKFFDKFQLNFMKLSRIVTYIKFVFNSARKTF